VQPKKKPPAKSGVGATNKERKKKRTEKARSVEEGKENHGGRANPFPTEAAAILKHPSKTTKPFKNCVSPIELPEYRSQKELRWEGGTPRIQNSFRT